MAMSVEVRLARTVRAQGELELSAPRLAGEEFLEQQRLLRDGLDGAFLHHGSELVAQRQEARGLDSDDGNAALRMRAERVDEPRQLHPRLVHQAGAEERAPAAQRARRRVLDDATAGGFEDAAGCARVLGLEIAGEAIDEEDDVLARLLRRLRTVDVAPPGRQLPLRAHAGELFGEPGERPRGVAQIDQRSELARRWSIAGEIGGQSRLCRDSIARVPVVQGLDL